MSRFSRFELIEHSPFPSFFSSTEGSFFFPETLVLDPCFPSFSIEDELDLTLDLRKPFPATLPALLDFPSPFSDFDAVTDLIQIEKTPFYTSTRRVQRRVDRVTELYLQALSDRVSALELSFHRLTKEKTPKIGERKYTWTAEIKSGEENGFDRKYEFVAEVKDRKKKGTLDKSYKSAAEIKGKGEDSAITKTYIFKALNGDAAESSVSSDQEEMEKEINYDKKKKDEKSTRLIAIQDYPDNGAVLDYGAVLLQRAFKRGMEKSRGKRKKLSEQDAVMKIQEAFKDHRTKRLQASRLFRKLAIAKTKLKEARDLFNNFSNGRRAARHAEDRQRVLEKIEELRSTVDAIEEDDLTARAVKKSMLDVLERMIVVVDSQPAAPEGNH